MPGELHAALVLATCASCSLEKVDPSPALALQGVEAFFRSQDLRGINNLTYHKKFAQPLFAEDKITHAGQVRCTLNIWHCTLSVLVGLLFIVHCTLYMVQCSLSNADCMFTRLLGS